MDLNNESMLAPNQVPKKIGTMKKEMRILVIPLGVHASFDFRNITIAHIIAQNKWRHKPFSKTRLNENNIGRNGIHGC
jgi:hypothetical protein